MQWGGLADISIHALREEGDIRLRGLLVVRDISIHALREEGDLKEREAVEAVIDFYPRPPRGGRQLASMDGGDDDEISIHALREEGDFEKLPSGT